MNQNEENGIISELLESFKNMAENKTNPFWEELKTSASFRPTIYIGVGGFGCEAVRELKKSIQELIPDEKTRQGFGFIGIDTHNPDKADVLTNNEYIGVIGIEPHVVATQKENRSYLGWYTELSKGSWRARGITAGAGQVRAVGRIAFLYPPSLNKFLNILSSTYNRVIQYGEYFSSSMAPKVYLISSLAGGTGSGMFLDVSIITSHYLRNRIGSELSMSAIVATADVFESAVPAIQMPDLYANTYLSLKDLYGLSTREIKATYKAPDLEDITANMINVPNPIFLITGQNDVGKMVFRSHHELRSIVVSYLLFEILTPLGAGQAKVQDKENDNSDKTGNGEMRTLFSSYGSIRFGVPSKEIREYYSYIILRDALKAELSNELTQEEIYSFINGLELGEAGSDQLQEKIRKLDGSNEFRFLFEIGPEIENVSNSDLARTCKSIIESKSEQTKQSYFQKFNERSLLILSEVKLEISRKLEELLNTSSLACSVSFIERLTKCLKDEHQNSLNRELSEAKELLSKAKEQTKNAIGNIALAAQSGMFGRKTKIKMAVDSFEQEFDVEMNQQIRVWTMDLSMKVYDELLSHLNGLYRTWELYEKKIEARRSYVDKEIQGLMYTFERMHDISLRGKGNRLSVLNVYQISQLYNDYIGKSLGDEIGHRLRLNWKSNNAIKNVDTNEESWCADSKIQLGNEIESKLSDLNLISVFNKFYSDNVPEQKTAKLKILETIFSLGAPLFHVNPHAMEPDYYRSWVIAVNPEIRDDMIKLLRGFIPAGAGESIATFPSKDEVIIYSIMHGYTPHSLMRMGHYYSHYNEAIRKFKIKQGETRPYYSRPEAETWPELIPISKEDEETKRLFSMARALSYLFPTATKENNLPDPEKNEAFIYSRGNYYYMNTTINNRTKKEKLGNGLQPALEKFGGTPDFQDYMKVLIENLINEKGRSLVKKRLESEYLPILNSEIDRTDKSDPDRATELDDLKAELLNYIQNNLIVTNL
ncbi:MAG: hypothetical protein IH591_09585 [Bacteroidales bacterium]|nr:hypothetical protein [Bacteroidales bacterium]